MNKPYDRPLKGNRCQCGGCYEYFNSVYSFDEHRTGPWTEQGKNRRCFTHEEMMHRGMSLNSAGFWITKVRPKIELSAGAS